MKKTSTEAQIKLYKVAARPTLLYGSETWVTNKREDSRITAAKMRFLRGVQGSRRIDRIRNMEDSRLPKYALNYKPKGKRDRGRPRGRWQNRVLAGTGLTA